MAIPDRDASLRIELVDASSPGRLRRLWIDLAPASSISDALAAAGLAATDSTMLTVGVFGRRREASDPVSSGDRIELYRPLLADPKLARRARVVRNQPPGRGR